MSYDTYGTHRIMYGDRLNRRCPLFRCACLTYSPWVSFVFFLFCVPCLVFICPWTSSSDSVELVLFVLYITLFKPHVEQFTIMQLPDATHPTYNLKVPCSNPCWVEVCVQIDLESLWDGISLKIPCHIYTNLIPTQTRMRYELRQVMREWKKPRLNISFIYTHLGLMWEHTRE